MSNYPRPECGLLGILIGELNSKSALLLFTQPTETLFDVCSFSGRNSMEGTPGCTLVTESSRGSEKGQNPFASMGVGKQLNQHFGCEVLITYDPRRSTPQYPVKKEARLGSGIGNRVGGLN